MNLRLSWSVGVVAALMIGATGATGCGGFATVEWVPLNYREIDPPKALATHVRLSECYWWLEDDGRVGVAMQERVRVPWSPGLEQSLQISLEFERLPAGRARNYEVGRRELRARVRAGPLEGRFTSRVGIATLSRDDSSSRLSGSFRIASDRQVAGLLGGFGTPSHYLVQGVFEAIRDPDRGRAIATSTEAAGFERERSAGTAVGAGESPSHKSTDQVETTPAKKSP